MKARFAHPVISPWFQPRSESVSVMYRNGKAGYTARENGSGRIYYPSGKVAVKIVKKGHNKQITKIWVYDSGEADIDGKMHPYQLCALFDSLGNGVVYDRFMRKRLVYNQVEGIVLDSAIKIPIFWKWHDFKFTGSVNDLENPSLAADKTQEAASTLPDPTTTSRPTERSTENMNTTQSNKSSLNTPATKWTEIEPEFLEFSEAFKYIDTGKLQPFKVSPVKPIFFRINKYFSLRIFSQSEISLSFFADHLHTQLKIGVLYNPHDKLNVTEIDDSLFLFDRVVCPFESFPAKTESMVKFQKFLHEKRQSSGDALSLISI